MNKNLKKGFTLIELLVVIAIIGILSSVVLVSLNSARGKARDAARKSNAQAITSALSIYTDAFNNDAPVAGDAAACPVASTAEGWTIAAVVGTRTVGCPNALVSTYIPRLPTDKSANVYAYVSDTAATKTFCLGARLENPNVGFRSFQCGTSGCAENASGPAVFSTDAWTAANCPAS